MPENVFDLNNVFVYYLSEVLNRPNVPNYLEALDTSQVLLMYTGTPIYTPPLEQNLQGTPQVLAITNFMNDTSALDTFTLNRSETSQASFSVRVTEGIKIGASTTLTASIPFVNAQVKLSAEASLSSTETISSTETQTFSFQNKINVPRRRQIQANLIVDSLQYTGTLTAEVAVSGQLGLRLQNQGNSPSSVSIASIFGAIIPSNNSAPINFSKTDAAGNRFSLTAADVRRFIQTPNGVTYTTTANINAKYGLSTSVQVTQSPLPTQTA